jgi:hypothetical protein
MENVSLIMKVRTFLTCAKASEILSSLWHFILEELESYSTLRMVFFSFFTNLNVEKYLRIFLIKLR